MLFGANMLEMESDDDSDEIWSGEGLGLEECLFCPHVSNDFENNIEHMTVEHSFFIPDIEYLVDLEGFISHLGGYIFFNTYGCTGLGYLEIWTFPQIQLKSSSGRNYGQISRFSWILDSVIYQFFLQFYLRKEFKNSFV